MKLDNQPDDCTGQLMPSDVSLFPCSDGFSLSFWVKIPKNQPGLYFRNIYNSATIRITYDTTLRVIDITFRRDWKWNRFRSLVSLSNDKWHHFAATFDGNLNNAEFIDGCRQPFIWQKSDPNPIITPQHTYTGCFADGRFCANVTIDELRIWNEKKDDHFIWYLFKANYGTP